MRIGVYGGTFDPIHTAHLIIAEHTREQLDLDLVLFIPSYIPPHKTEAPLCDALNRLEMVKTAVKDHPHFQTIDFEIKRQKTSYTVHTLEHIRDTFRLEQHELYLLMGADNYIHFDKWKSPQTIYKMCRLTVAGRPNAEVQVSHEFTDVLWVNAPLLEISASDIRDRLATGKSIRYIVPHPVEQYIKHYNLY
ncbi:MAG: nicotinate-nucleotide adenylyltransferase [candidate division KSB1 bacterium]|nr:nicotinate-nucleotide adenylyltransferase [candidate division KSB1 bacterium]